MSDEVTTATEIALLRQSINNLSAKIDGYQTTISLDLGDHEKRIRDLESTVARLSERLTNWNFVQAGYATVASIISWFVPRVP